MKKYFYLCSILLILPCCFQSCSKPKNKILKAEFHLRSSNNVPSIDVYIDFEKDSNYCKQAFYDYPYGGQDYILDRSEVDRVRNLLENADLSAMEKEFDHDQPDLLYPDAEIFTDKTVLTFPDNSRVGDKTLKEIFKIVFKY